MRAVAAILFSIWASGLVSQPAHAEKRVALAIGNSNYQNVGHLANPASDAATLAETFRKANFDVVTLRADLPAAEMRRALREFGDKARDADIAVIYYAGHGIEIDGTNYLIPIDATLEHDTDVYDEALSLDRVLVAVEPAKRLRLVILDACRDNPFAKTMRQTIARRSIGRGLAKVEPPGPNTMIAFAAKAGFTAFDGDDAKSSPFATALAQHLTTPGLDLRKAFGFVRDDVLKATNNRQEPFIYGSLGGDDVALIPAPVVAAPPAPDPNEALRRDYEFAERIGTKEAWDSFLASYPGGFYAKLAQAQRNKLAAEEARLAATEKARLAAEERARLAAEGAKAAEQAKAAAEAKAAEDARIAAEKKKA
jgi:Caspase domain